MSNEIKTSSIGSIVEEGYSNYQKFVNNGRFIPGIDGLKMVYRRTLLSVKAEAKTRFMKSALIVGNTMKWHPHGDTSIQDTLSSLVRWGFVSGQGNHGDKSYLSNISASAMRYTEVKYNNKIDDILFKFEKYFLWKAGEIEGYDEPEFLITPIPIALLRGSIGIGVGGVISKIPAFSYQSILDAYKYDDPKLLKSAYGLRIDYEKSNLQKLWTKGSGKIHFEFDVYKNPSNSKEVVIEGNASVFKPKLDQIRAWEKQKLVYIRNESTTNMRLVVGRVKGIRKITENEIYNACKEAGSIGSVNGTYIIMVAFNGSVVRLGIKQWLDITMKLYEATFTKWQSSTINSINTQIKILGLIPQVAELIKQDKSLREISTELNEKERLIKIIEDKPLKMMRKTDFSSRIKKLEIQREKVESSKVEDFINNGKIVDDCKM